MAAPTASLTHLEVRVDALAVLSGLDNARQRMAYALVNTLNNTAKAVQREQKAGLRRRFTVRKPKFVERQAAIIDFASVPKGKLQASVVVGQRPRLLLSTLETGGRRPPAKGRRVAVPHTGGPARPTFGQSVQEAFTFRQLRLIGKVGGLGGRKRRKQSTRNAANVDFVAVKSKGGVQYKGAQRTFILTSTAKAPEGGVYQRVGPKRDDIRLVYSFGSNVKLRPLLQWMVTARSVVDRVMGPELGKQVADTLAHAFRRAGRAASAFGIGR